MRLTPHMALFALAAFTLASLPEYTLAGAVPVPNYPDAYELEYYFSMPYMSAVQPQGLRYKVHAWHDKAAKALRVDILNTSTLYFESAQYNVLPKNYKLACNIYNSAINPHADAAKAGGLLGQAVLPALKGWSHQGYTSYNDHNASIWSLKVQHEEKTFLYTFFIGVDGTPLRLHSLGEDLFGHSHFDEYIYEFVTFNTGPVDSAVFAIPQLCKERGAELLTTPSPVAAQNLALLPSFHLSPVDAFYSHVSNVFGRVHKHLGEWEQRLGNFKAAKKYVDEFNSRVNRTFQLGINHLADVSREEMTRVILPRRMRQPVPRTPENGFQPLYVFNKTLGKAKLPKSLDWRGTPADVGVKDQAQCGSCFTFGATGTMESTWYLATGESRSLSEQALVSCSWDVAKGCAGGDYQPVMTWLGQHGGGVARLEDYPYVGKDDFCKRDEVPYSAWFKGYVQIPYQDEEAVMEALYLHGPLAVAVDATSDEYTWYSSGIYRQKDCKLKPLQLDHVVLLVGYGTDESSGQDYWLVKNSWSRFWGEDGYFKTARGKGANDCGISSDACFAVVDDKYVVPGLADELRAKAAKNWKW